MFRAHSAVCFMFGFSESITAGICKLSLSRWLLSITFPTTFGPVPCYQGTLAASKAFRLLACFAIFSGHVTTRFQRKEFAVDTHMRRFLVFVGVGSLAFSLACGGGSSNGGGFGSGGGGNGSFSNATLSGQYAFQLSGFDLLSQVPVPFREAGVFTADGNGHIT